ncbi:hypothetical protein [Novipirellula herctigrandis]|uniref:hypothetical protein n=1 Tax=Novipirellula herctigrandis TaxID=2527986 RepID=UPI003AF38AF6
MLVFAWTEQLGTPSSAATAHLPELGFRPNEFEETRFTTSGTSITVLSMSTEIAI